MSATSRRPGAKPGPRPGFQLRAGTTMVLMCAVLLSACATSEAPPKKPTLLEQADAKLAAEDYTGAIASYSEFVSAAPQDPQAMRVRATQKALEKLVAAQAALARTQQSTDKATREATERATENDRLKAEVAKLRGDLERLRNIDLQAPARTK